MYAITKVRMYVRMYVHATYKTPYGPQDINKRPYPLWSIVFITTIKKNIFTWLKEIYWQFNEFENADILYYWLWAAYRSLYALKGLQTQETSLATYCTVLEKNIFIHKHKQTHTHTQISFGSMRSTNYEVSHYVLFIDPYYFPLLSFSLFLSPPSFSRVQIIWCLRQIP
jgi:hypothetical protein